MPQSTVVRVLCLVTALLMAGSLNVLAQQAEESQEAPLTVAVSEASPGTVVYVSLRFNATDPLLLVQQIRTTVCFPGDVFAFENFFLNQDTAAVGAEAQHELEESPECTRLSLEITFRTPPPTGFIGNLEFRVSGSAPVGSEAGMKIESELIGQGGANITSLANEVVEIIEPVSVFACFFYLH
jgi:hypothetical protein